MGFEAAAVDRMSLWQFAAAWDAFRTFHGVKTPRTGGPTDAEIDEFDDMVARLG